jgi:hypothetical protein
MHHDVCLFVALYTILTNSFTHLHFQVKDVTSLSRRSFRMFRSIVHVNRIYNTVSNLIDDKCDTLLDDVLINSVGILEDFLLVKCNALPTFIDSTISRIKLHCFALLKMYNNTTNQTRCNITNIINNFSISAH